MINLFIVNPKEKQRTLLLKELQKNPDAWSEYESVLKVKEHEVPSGEVILIADRVSKKMIALSFSLTRQGINPFALAKSLSHLHKVFLTNSLVKEIDMNWELNKITKKELEELEINQELLKMMK